MFWFLVSVVILVTGVLIVLAVARGAEMAPAYDDRREVRLPVGRHLRADDLAATRFTLAVRGYRMSEVDALVDRLQVELAEREHGPGRDDPSDVTGARHPGSSGEGGPMTEDDHAR